MSVLTSSDRLAIKSTLRHRPISLDTKLSEPPRVPWASRTHTGISSVSPPAPSDIPVWKHKKKRQAQWQQSGLLVGMGAGMLLAVSHVGGVGPVPRWVDRNGSR